MSMQRECRRRWLIACMVVIAGCQSGGHAIAPVATGVKPMPTKMDVGIDSPVVFRFATVGDSRQEPNNPGNTAQDEIWLQSTAVWARMLHEIERQRPQALIFNGDMVYGYRKDLAALDREYAFWRGMIAGLMERGTYVIPVPGNHEVQWSETKSDGSTVKAAVEVKEHAWRANMGDLIIDVARWQKLTGTDLNAWHIGNTPAQTRDGGADGISTDQRQLSYSFDVGEIHIAVINTDPVGNDASAPTAWLARDMGAAQIRGAKRFFVFGHKPAFTYFPEGADKKKADGFDGRPALRDAFWDVIEKYDATYFCGHQHVYHASQPRIAQGGKAWQVIAGTGGSPFSIKPRQSARLEDRLYAWVDVSVHKNGGVLMQAWGFDENFDATRLIESRMLSPPLIYTDIHVPMIPPSSR